MSKDVVKRQGVKSLIINILSIFLGIVNNLYVYPMFLGLYGTFQMFWKFISLMTPFSMFGLVAVINRYFKEYENRGKDFLFFILKWFGISFLAFSSFYFFILPYLIDSLKSILPFIEIVESNKIVMYLAILFYTVNLVLINISYIHKRIVVPIFLNKILTVKVLIPLCIILTVFFKVDTNIMLWSFTGVLILIFITLLIYVSYNKWIENTSDIVLPKTNLSEVLSFGAFGSLNQMGIYFAFSIDIILVYFTLGDTATGFYAIFLFLSNVVRLPIDSLSGLFLPIVNSLLREKKMTVISDYYRRLSNILFFLCTGIFITLYFSLTDILKIINKDNLLNAKYIFIYISLGIIINGLTYMNSAIIQQSVFYRWNLLFMIALSVLNVIISYQLITNYFPTEYASAGAACGTAISFALFNLASSLFVYLKFKMHPFSKTTIVILLFGIFAFISLSYIKLSFIPYINIMMYSIIIGLLYFVPIYLLKEVKDFNEIVHRYYSKARAFIN